MKDWIKKRDRWIAGILSPVLVGIISKELKDIPFFSYIWEGIGWFWNGFIWVMNLDLRLWWILLFFATAFIVLLILNWIYNLMRQAKEQIQPPKYPKFIDYKEDVINGMLWAWDWDEGYDGEWKITNLNVCCPQDKTPLLFYECPRCHKNYYDSNLDEQAASIIIIDNIKKRGLNVLQ